MRDYYVYILKCSDESYYVGVTNNLERRFAEHCEGKSTTSYTSKRRPLELIWSMRFKYILEAIAFEKQVKGWSKKKKEALMKDDWDTIVLLANTKKSDALKIK